MMLRPIKTLILLSNSLVNGSHTAEMMVKRGHGKVTIVGGNEHAGSRKLSAAPSFVAVEGPTRKLL
jgi:hypothetical protein